MKLIKEKKKNATEKEYASKESSIISLFHAL